VPIHKARRILLGAAALAAFGAAPAPASAAGPAPSARAGGGAGRWSVFESEAGRFRVELPGEPRLEQSERSTLLGAVSEARYILRLGDIAVVVETHDIPRIATRIVPTRTILDRTRSGVLEDMEAQLVASSEIALQGYPARDFTYRLPSDPPQLERAIAVLVGNRIYLVTGVAPEAPGARPDIARFFASFRFWPEDTPPPGNALEIRAESNRSGAR
jgi:hypothetical protein